jgi:hypothetical protein
MFCQNFRRNRAVEAAKHPTTTTTFITITTFILPAATGRNRPSLLPSTMTNAQENNLHLSALPLTKTTRGRGTGVPSSPGLILEMSTGPQYSLLGAKLCRMSPRHVGREIPRRFHWDSAHLSGPPIPCVVPGSYIGSNCCSRLHSLPPHQSS